MLPSQILLNNLLYDDGQMTIPSDRVDEEQLARPSHWDVGFIRRFMVFFGPISSIFDFLTFAVMINVFDAGPRLFRSGWFVESLATQSLVIFVIRTRRVPFLRSRPGRLLTATTLAVVVVGAVLPMSPLGHDLRFRRLPAGFFGVLVLMVAGYLVLVEAGKREFYAHLAEPMTARASTTNGGCGAGRRGSATSVGCRPRRPRARSISEAARERRPSRPSEVAGKLLPFSE
jgi:Mg2+-importing ATPase